MKKCLAVILIALGLTSCTEKNRHYYQLHPQELQENLKECPQKKPSFLSCAELQSTAEQMNTLAYELQNSPQGFGLKIVSLQELLATQHKEFANTKDNSLKNKIIENERVLAEYLAIVKWLESPAS